MIVLEDKGSGVDPVGRQGAEELMDFILLRDKGSRVDTFVGHKLVLFRNWETIN